MSKLHTRSSPQCSAFFSVCFLFLSTTQAQLNIFPATPSPCNFLLKYYCFGGEYCCPLPAVCIPGVINGIPFSCVSADGFDVNGGTGGVSGGGGAIFPTTSIRSDTASPVVIPTPSPVVPGGNAGSPSGGGIVTTLSLPQSPLTSSIPLLSISTSRFSTSGLPVPTSSSVSSGIVTTLSLPQSPLTSSIPLPSISTSRFSTSSLPVPTSSSATGGITGGNNNGAVTPVTPSTRTASSIVPSSSPAPPNGGGSEGGGGNGSSGGGQTSNNGSSGNPGSGSGSASNRTAGNGTVIFTGTAPMGFSWLGGAWGSIIVAGLIASMGAFVVE